MYVVADIGGTKMRVAASSDLATFEVPVIIDTPHAYEAGIAALVDAAKTVADGERIERMCIGLPGSLDTARRTIFRAPNLPRWCNKSIAQELETALSTTVVMENDVALVALGEAHFGAGKGAKSMVYMTVSTGVNAARIVGGVLDQGVFNAETGGQYFFHDGTFKTFEDLVSGHAVEKKYGRHPKDLGPGHPVWEELAEIVALGLYNTILHWSPERVVLGGSMFNEIGIPVESVAKHLTRINKKYPAMPEVVHSALVDIGGLWGGIARLTQYRSENGTGGTAQ